MKKIYLAVFLACSIGGAVHAQESWGGLPLSMSLKKSDISAQAVSKFALARPDYDAYEREDLQDALTGAAKPYRVAAYVPADINLEKGTWSYLENGAKIWRASITVPDAKAIAVFYDKFNLPEGVKLYLYNNNGNQILGAYTQKNNSLTFQNFVNEEVVGNIVTLELNIEPGVDISKILFHVNKVTAYYRGVSELERRFAATDDVTAARPTGVGDASPCHINANCPAGDGDAWAKAKKASVQITMGNAVCSGTLINNTGNTQGGTCTPLILTASHCEGTNSFSDEAYSNWVFRFNYQSVTCAGTSANDNPQTRNGATFKARSNNPSFAAQPNSLVCDFLLLQMASAPPATAYLAGWNRNTNLAQNPDNYPKFISFHHPAGDLKKLAYTEFIDAAGSFNQIAVLNTHWTAYFSVGGKEGGSSGSGLFDHEGLLMSDLSGGQATSGPCAPLGTEGLYSKLSQCWDNTFDQTNHPGNAGAKSQLKGWLDPAGTGTTKLQPIKADCSDAPVGISELEKQLNAAVALFPNPSTGLVFGKMNFAETTDVDVQVISVTGVKQLSFALDHVRSGQYSFDLSSLSSGIYLFNITAKGATVSKKVVISK